MKRLVEVLCVVCSMLLVVAAYGQQTVICEFDQDVLIASNGGGWDATTNYNDYHIVACGDENGGILRGMIYCDFDELPVGPEHIISATLVLTHAGNSGDGIDVQGVIIWPGGWNEATATWANDVFRTAWDPFTTVHFSPGDQTIELNMTDQVIAWLQGAENNGVAIRAEDENDDKQVYFNSREDDNYSYFRVIIEMQLDPPQLVAPTDGFADVPTDAILDWDPVDNATSYTVEWDVDPGFGDPQTATTAVTEYAPGFAFSTTYSWRVYASNGDVQSDYSDEWSFSTEAEPLDPPQLVSPADGLTNVPTSAILDWDPVNNATSYTVEWDVDPAFGDPQTVTTTVTEYAPGFENSTTYNWRVFASNASQNSDYSEEWSFSTVGTPIVFDMIQYTETIPPTGGQLYYAVHLENQTGGPLTAVSYWVIATLPDGSEVEAEVMGPFNLPAGFSVAAYQRSKFVPAVAPEGDYVYTGYFGYYPNTPLVHDSFPFHKAGAVGMYDGNWPVERSSDAFGLLDNIANEDAVSGNSDVQLSVSPNPFNPATNLSLTLTKASNVHIVVVDILGRQVVELASSHFQAGTHSVTFDGSNLPSGVYFIQVQIPGEQPIVRKVMLMK